MPGPPTVTAITIKPDSPSLLTGASKQLTATATNVDNSATDVTTTVKWSVSPVEIATVDSNGLLTGTSGGAGTVQAVLTGSGAKPGMTAVMVVDITKDHLEVPIGGTCPKCGWVWGSSKAHVVAVPVRS